MIYNTKALLTSALILRAADARSGSGSASGSGSGSGSGTIIISGSGSGSGSSSGSMSGSGSGGFSGSGSGSGSSTLQCEDYPNWSDATYTCADYESNSCADYDPHVNGIHAGTACCACGGGHQSGSSFYVAEPNQGCQTALTQDQCRNAATEAGAGFVTTENSGVPSGCSIQRIDHEVVWNTVTTYFTNVGADWHETDWCPQGPGENCIIQACCSPDWWDTRKDGTSCPDGEHLTQDDCMMVFETNQMFQDGSLNYNMNDESYPHGCFGDRTTMGGGFNNNPNGFLSDFDSGEGGGYFYWPFCTVTNVNPTPAPTFFERPTPSPTAPPTNVPIVEQKVLEFVLQNKHGGFCFDAKNRRNRGGTVHMWECQQKGEALDWNRNQHWDMHVVDENLNSVMGMVKSHDGICLDASEARNGGKVWMWPCKQNNKRQMWSYDKITGHLRSAVGPFCLDARQRETQSGYVHMWSCLPGEKNQQFHMLQNPEKFPYMSKKDYSMNILETGTWQGSIDTAGAGPVPLV